MKKHSISINDIPEDKGSLTHGMQSPLQDKIDEYIKKYPHCTRKDLYSLDPNEGHVRRAITSMLQSCRIKETFTIVK